MLEKLMSFDLWVFLELQDCHCRSRMWQSQQDSNLKHLKFLFCIVLNTTRPFACSSCNWKSKNYETWSKRECNLEDRFAQRFFGFIPSCTVLDNASASRTHSWDHAEWLSSSRQTILRQRRTEHNATVQKIVALQEEQDIRQIGCAFDPNGKCTGTVDIDIASFQVPCMKGIKFVSPSSDSQLQWIPWLLCALHSPLATSHTNPQHCPHQFCLVYCLPDY